MKLDKALDIIEDMTIVVMIIGFALQTYSYVLDIIGMGDKTTKLFGLAGMAVIVSMLIINVVTGWAHDLYIKTRKNANE